MTGASHQSKPSSMQMEEISLAIEHTGQPSSTTTRRLVFLRLSSTVALSSGRRVRRSMTSASMPSPASCSAASSRSEEHTSDLQSLMRNSYAVFDLQKKKHANNN